MKNHFVLVLWLAFTAVLVHAQPRNIGFDHYSLEEGISHTTVYCITQDPQGYIWLGTKEGLNRFDGYEFSAYEYELNDTASLSGTGVLSFLIDSKNRFWVGTNAGLNLFDRKTRKAHRIPYGSATGEGTSNGTIWAIAEDKEGNIWFATDEGLNKWDEKEQRFVNDFPEELYKGTIYTIFIDNYGILWLGTRRKGFQVFDPKLGTVKTFDEEKGLKNNEVRGLIKDSKGRVWVSSGKALHRFDPEQETFVYYEPTSERFIETGNTNVITEDKDGMIWVGSWGKGLNLYLEDQDRFASYTHDSRVPSSLGDNFVNNIFEDRDGGIWAATSGGVSRFDKHRKHFVNYRKILGVSESMSSSIINNVLRDREGRLWIATKTGGINLWQGKAKGFRHFMRDKNDPTTILRDRVNRLSQDLEGNIWAATNKGVAVLNPNTGKFRNYRPDANTKLTASYIQTVLCDSLGNKWIGTVAGLDKYIGEKAPYFEPVTLLKNKKGEREKFLINNIIEDKDHNLWIGTFGKGLLHLNPRTGNIKAYQHNDSVNSISNNHIYYIYLEGNVVWIGTNGSGLDRLDTKTGKFENFSTKDGLPNNVINGILADKHGNLWISTNKGICRFNKKTKITKVYDASYGIQSNLFRRRACWKDPDGRLYFGGLSGLTAFYPDDIIDNPIKPVIHIEQVEVFEGEGDNSKVIRIDMSDKESISLPYDKNNFIIEFIGLNYSMAKHNAYRYRLVGFDRMWLEAGIRRDAGYTNVPPGEYIFRVQAANNDGLWNRQGASIKIRVGTPPWKTWWAIVLYVIAALSSVIIIVKWRTGYYRRLKKLLEDTVKARTFELVESREELRSQRDELEHKTKVLAAQSKQIKDSINYAERIQLALLNSSARLTDEVEECFLFFRPRDVLSGDFYWAGQIGGRFTLVAADCTGHGVPGAFLSVLGITYLNEISAMNTVFSAGEVLDILREKIKHVFKGTTSHIVSDGMDMALCMFSEDKKQLDYAGAYNPLYMIRNGELIKYKADIMPIGYYVRSQKKFGTQTIDIQEGDTFYLFTDGYVDQFGGKNGHKFMMKNFRRLLLDINKKPLAEQEKLVGKTIDEYKDGYIQVDDMLVIGFRIGKV